MAEIIRFRKEFLPHIIRLFSPDVQRIDARLNYFQQLFALYQPSPEQSCLLIKGQNRLLACAYLVTLDKVQPDLVFVNLAVDRELTPEIWSSFWSQCVDVAKSLVSGPPVLRIAAGGDVPAFIPALGFEVVREQVELHAPLGQLPLVQAGEDEFNVISLADHPDQEGRWLDVFNHGLTVFWDIPPLDAESMQRLRSLSGFDGSAFRLGLEGEEPVTALFYSVLDSSQGTVRINAAATPPGKRSRGYGRRMIKDTLNHLEQEGLKEAIIYTDSANQATNLLFKMLGFVPSGTIKILECRTAGMGNKSSDLQQEAAAAMDGNGKIPSEIFQGFHSAFVTEKQ